MIPGAGHFGAVAALVVLYLAFLAVEGFSFSVFSVYFTFIFPFFIINVTFFDFLSELLGRTFLIDFMPKAFLITIVSLILLLAGFIIGKKAMPGQSKLLFNWFRIPDMLAGRTYNIVRVLCFLGVLFVFLSMFLMDIFPFFASDPMAAKFFANEYHASYEKFLYMFRTGLILIGICCPVLVIEFLRREKSGWNVSANLLILFLIAAAATVTLRRGIALNPAIMFCIISVFIAKGKALKTLIGLSVLMAAAIGLAIMLNVFIFNGYDLGIAQNVIGNIADYQDFSYAMYLFDGEEYLMGKTYLAALVPLPPSMSELRRNYTTANVTKRLMGMESDSPHGGLRIFYFGEAFLNFGYAGAAIISLFFGVFMGIMSEAARRLKESSAPLESIAFYCLMFVITIYGFFQGGFSMDTLVALILAYFIYRVLPRLAFRKVL